MSMLISLTCCGLKEFGGIADHHDYEPDPSNLDSWGNPRQKAVYNKEHAQDALYTWISAVRQHHGFDRPGIKLEQFQTLKCGGIIFSGAVPQTKQDTLPKYVENILEIIQEGDFGAVHALPTFVNPNTGNIVKPFLWVVNTAPLLQWWREEYTRRSKPEAPK
jgi:hypothetical protein